MAQFMGRVVGDYLVGRQIGSGSFSVVWEASHRVDGTEVAIKEIAMDRLNKKLHESLMSEILILRRISHPNIIRIVEMIKSPGKVHLMLEYCKGGDLSVYVQRHKFVPEATAKHFMQQLAADLKPQKDDRISVLVELILGRVEEVMGDIKNAGNQYSKGGAVAGISYS